MRRETRRPGDLESFPVFNVVLIVGIITLLGFAVGVRPRRQVRAVRFWAVLTTFSVLVAVATSVLMSEEWFRLLESWGVDEFDMIGGVRHSRLDLPRREPRAVTGVGICDRSNSQRTRGSRGTQGAFES